MKLKLGNFKNDSGKHLIRSLYSFQIEDVTAAQLEILVQQQNYLAVFFCKLEMSHH